MIAKLGVRLRWLFKFWVTSYPLLLLFLALGFRHLGENNLFFAYLLYLPPLLWWLPLVSMVPCVLFWRIGVLPCLLSSAVCLVFFPAFERKHLPERTMRKESVREFVVLTHNMGQQGKQDLSDFLQEVTPDVMALQESNLRGRRIEQWQPSREFPHHQSLGEYTLLSRHPILSSEKLTSITGRGRFFAARFVVDWKGREVAIYSVHLQSPRETLYFLTRGAFLYGLLGFPGSPWETKRVKYEEFWRNQISDASQLLERVRADPLPCILAGDFNATDLGYIHGMLTHELGDAHAEAGRGTGYSFPGQTRNPLSAGGPWMRIDYVFYNQRWRALACQTERGRPSQHLAVAARLEFMGD